MKIGLLVLALLVSVIATNASVGQLGQPKPVKKGEKMGWTAYHGMVMTQARQVDIDLEAAVEENDLTTVKKLLAAGGNPNYEVRPPLLELRGTHKQMLAMATLLIEHGANVNAVDYMQRSVLHLAIEGFFDREKDPDPADLVRFYLSHGTKTEIPDGNGSTALHLAVARGKTKCVRTLLDFHANPNARANADKYRLADKETQDWNNRRYERGYKEVGITPLHMLMEYGGKAAMMATLVESGADPKLADANGWTALHYAVLDANWDGVRFCLNHGLPADAPTKLGSTPLMIAVGHNLSDLDPKMVALLVGGSKPSLHSAFEKQARAELKRLAFDPNYAEGLNPKEILENLNQVAKLLNPKATALVMPRVPVGADGIHYLPLDWVEMSVSRVVKREKGCVRVTLGFQILPSESIKGAQVMVKNFRLGSSVSRTFSLTVKKGQTKFVRLTFPVSTNVGAPARGSYTLRWNSGGGRSGSI